MNPISVLLVALGIFAVGYLYVFIAGLRRDAADGQVLTTKPVMGLISFVANFFDTLGVGSYATTTAMVRFFKLMPDEKIPGSLNVGYVLPTMIQAYVTIHGVSALGYEVKPVEVDPLTLILLILAAILGAWLGAGVVSSWPRRKIQLGMGLCLAAAAVIMLVRLTIFHSLEVGATGLTGIKLAIGIVGLFGLGALMTLGIGLYAPCMILISLLGMNPTAAFPIMMGSCAFLMPMASVRFVRTKAYDVKAIVGMMLAGIPAVLVAAFIVKSMPMYAVKWLVIVVVTYTAINLLRAAQREKDLASKATAAEAAPA